MSIFGLKNIYLVPIKVHNNMEKNTVTFSSKTLIYFWLKKERQTNILDDMRTSKLFVQAFFFFLEKHLETWPDVLALCVKVLDEILKQVDAFLDLDFIDFEEVL